MPATLNIPSQATSGAGFQSSPSAPVAEPPAHQPDWLISTASPVPQQASPVAGSTSPLGPQAPSTDASHVVTAPNQFSHPHQRATSSGSRPRSPNQNEGNPLLELLLQQQAAAGGQNAAQASGNSPLLFTLIVMSLVVSLALVALLILGSGSNSSPSSSASYGRHHHQSPLDK